MINQEDTEVLDPKIKHQRAVAHAKADAAWQEMYRNRVNPKRLRMIRGNPSAPMEPRPALIYAPNGVRECARRRRQLARLRQRQQQQAA